MHEVVDQVMLSVKQNATFWSRSKVYGYVELLSRTGKRDPHKLASLGVERLREIGDGLRSTVYRLLSSDSGNGAVEIAI